MVVNPPFMYDQPSKYSLISGSEKAFEPKAATHASWVSKPPRPRPNGPYISAEDLNRQHHSYMIVPYGNQSSIVLPQNTKNVVKWTRVALLILRICSWLGAAGLLVCVVCVRPIGSTMDWVMRVPSGVALIHLTYSIYHLSRSAKARTPTSSGSYMIFSAIIDSCLIPFLVLIAILARNQLIEALDDGTEPWEVLLGAGYQRHTIIYSTFLIGLTTAGLHLVSLCVCIFLAMKFRKISQLPPDMNPLEDNLTSRGHKKAKTSVSTFMTESTNRGSTSQFIDGHQHALRTSHNRFGSESSVAESHNPRAVLGSPSGFSAAGLGHATVLSPNLSHSDESDYTQKSPRNDQRYRNGANGQMYSALAEDSENWGTHPPTPPGSPPIAPPEFQHLRNKNAEDEKLRPAPLSTQSKYDFTNRSPRPLGLHPPTPREATPNNSKGFDVRILRNIDGNTSAPKVSTSVWDDIKLELDSMDSSGGRASAKKQYGSVVGMGRVSRSQARVVSSGIDNDTSVQRVRMRDVSGKIAEEGRGGI